jgi:hypothetical protein
LPLRPREVNSANCLPQKLHGSPHKEGRCSSLKKTTKRLLPPRKLSDAGHGLDLCAGVKLKVCWFFSSEKNSLALIAMVAPAQPFCTRFGGGDTLIARTVCRHGDEHFVSTIRKPDHADHSSPIDADRWRRNRSCRPAIPVPSPS